MLLLNCATVFMCLTTFHMLAQSTITNNSANDCEIWKKQHIFNTSERHYLNITPYVIKFNAYSELNKSCKQHSIEAYFLNFYPNKNLLIDNDLDLRIFLNTFRFKSQTSLLIFQRVRGFNQMFNTSSVKNYLSLNLVTILNSYFDFYLNSTTLVTREMCYYTQFDKKLTNYFGSIKRIVFSPFYLSQVCPYVFMNTNLEEVTFNGISNSFIYKNRLEFYNLTETQSLNINKLQTVIFEFDYDHVSLKIVNTLIFSKMVNLIIHGIIYDIQTDFFDFFKEIRCIILSIENIQNFLHSGTKWMNYLNKDIHLNVSIPSNAIHHIMHRAIILELIGARNIFIKTYDYPNEDICLFKDFPHQQLVYPSIFLENANSKCSCTVIWLIQYSHVYLNKDYSEYDINIKVIYAGLYLNFTARNCYLHRDLLNQTKTCDFPNRLKNCQFKTTVSFAGMNSIHYFKWFEYIFEVYLKPFLCLLGILTNSVTIIIIIIKKKETLKLTMYNYMLANSIFNLIFCVVCIFSLINVCIFPRSSFCSSIHKEVFSQYFRIYIVDFFGEAIRICCNVSYFMFAISRFFVSTSHANGRLFKKFEKMKLRHFFACIFIFGLLLNFFKVFEYKISVPYSTVDIKFPFNAYEILYCENKFFFTSTFLFRCKLFPVLSLINSILNNIVYLFVSLVIDIMLIKFTYKNLERKRNLTNEAGILKEAAKFKKKVNKMIITNGILYSLSHFPQFLVTLMLFIFKKRLPDYCLVYFPCNDFLEIIQTCNLISMGFQFFIYYIFDKNICESFHCIKERAIKTAHGLLTDLF